VVVGHALQEVAGSLYVDDGVRERDPPGQMVARVA
jgi:hypothetical protein